MKTPTRRYFLGACAVLAAPLLTGCDDGGGDAKLPEPPGGVNLPEDPNDLPIMKDARAAKAKAKAKGKTKGTD